MLGLQLSKSVCHPDIFGRAVLEGIFIQQLLCHSAPSGEPQRQAFLTSKWILKNTDWELRHNDRVMVHVS